MKQKTIYEKINDKSLVYFNPNIRICLIDGNDNIEFFEHGISYEECRIVFGRSKCLPS